MAKKKSKAKKSKSGKDTFTRSKNGRFAAGNKGGDGRPSRQLDLSAELAAISLATISPDDWRSIIEKCVVDAKRGNSNARRFLFEIIDASAGHEGEGNSNKRIELVEIQFGFMDSDGAIVDHKPSWVRPGSYESPDAPPLREAPARLADDAASQDVAGQVEPEPGAAAGDDGHAQHDDDAGHAQHADDSQEWNHGGIVDADDDYQIGNGLF